MFTTKTEDPCTLGLDYLFPNTCRLDLQKVKMVIRCEMVHLEVTKAPTVKIFARKSGVIPSLFKKVVCCTAVG